MKFVPILEPLRPFVPRLIEGRVHHCVGQLLPDLLVVLALQIGTILKYLGMLLLRAPLQHLCRLLACFLHASDDTVVHGIGGFLAIALPPLLVEGSWRSLLLPLPHLLLRASLLPDALIPRYLLLRLSQRLPARLDVLHRHRGRQFQRRRGPRLHLRVVLRERRGLPHEEESEVDDMAGGSREAHSASIFFDLARSLTLSLFRHSIGQWMNRARECAVTLPSPGSPIVMVTTRDGV
mmetsp:Transcript_42482/g.128919  ORF Transcript_42482/g.128919 Transcript_42482/m.128919 type:complete len:236 (+) Transcript_42482:1370-2077(+)